MSTFDNWSGNDNKHVRGPRDARFISLTEPYELDYFVDAYLQHRGARVDGDGRRVVRSRIALFPGRAPILRAELVQYLDQHITVK